MNIFQKKYILSQAVITVVMIVFIQMAMAAPPLPREPKPKPILSGSSQGVVKPSLSIGTRPKFDPSNIAALPDLRIMGVRVSLLPQAISSCQTGAATRGALIRMDISVKNVGQGAANLRRYLISVQPSTTDGMSPIFFVKTAYPYGDIPSLAPGQTIQLRKDLGVTDVYAGHFPVSRYSELAGKTRRFKVDILTGSRINRGLLESNYRNNSKVVRYTFPRNFCQQNTLSSGVSQPVGQLAPRLVIQSINTRLRKPYECRTDGPTFADGNFVIKNTGGDFIPRSQGEIFNVDGGVNIGRNRLLLRAVGYLRSRIPAGATRSIRFALTGTAGILHMPTPSMSILAGRTVPISLSSFELNRFIGNHNSRIHFPADFCANKAVAGVNTTIGNNQTVKPTITGFQFTGGKNCLSSGGIFTIKGSAFGNSAGGRTIELGGNSRGAELAIKSWSNRSIRVQLPRSAGLQYRKNYWVAIRSASRAGRSNLKRGIVLCQPTVRTGTSGSSATPQTGQQNGGIRVAVNGLPDLEISRLTISSPRSACFSRGTNKAWGNYYTLPKLNVSLTLHNKGRVPYSTFDAVHNKPLPIGIIGDKYVGPKDRHNVSLCLVPVAHMSFSNLNIPAGRSKTIQTQMQIMNCPFRGRRVVNPNGRLAEPLVRTLLGARRTVKIGIGKAVFIRNKIPKESHYDNNFRRSIFVFPDRTCGNR